jgi:hypothetical protein
MSDVQKILHSAYSFIRGVESNKAASSITLDHLLQEQIDRLQKDSSRDITDSQGQKVDARPSMWDRLDALEKDVDNVVDAVDAAGDDEDRLNDLGLQETDQ